MLLGGVPMSFAEMVKAHRYKANLSISELAERTGVNRSVLARIESGETRRPSFSTCCKIASALDIPYDKVISFYLDVSERPETLKMLLSEAVVRTNRHIVRKAADKLLETPKLNTFLALDYILQQARESENEEIKLALYNVMIEYTKKRGIPFYLAKGLFERYLIERYDFSRLEETYRRGKELLVYIEYLQPSERIIAYYRLGLQAYALKYFDDCIHLCRQGIAEDDTESELKASALLAITNSYINMGDCILAELYLKKYVYNPFANANRTKYYLAQIHVKKGEFSEGIAGFKECLVEAERESRIAIATDLLEVYQQIGDHEGIEDLIKKEEQFLPQQINTPKKVEHLALYYKQKGLHQLANEMFEEGIENLILSASYYQKLGAFAYVNECIGSIFVAHRQYGKVLSEGIMEMLEKLCQRNCK
jgi:transcriptional regulator with XRE-family HTH domain